MALSAKRTHCAPDNYHDRLEGDTVVGYLGVH